MPRVDPDPATSPLGDRIRQHRLLAGLTQRQLGEAVGVSFTHISKIEAGKEVASTALLTEIARVLDADADEFMLLAERVPPELRAVVIEKGDLAPRFLRQWRDGHISDEQVERLLARSGVRGRAPHPYSHTRHEQKAAEVLATFSRSSKWERSLPVPVERIVESLGIRIEWTDLAEAPGERILGALDPACQVIYMNERHDHLFEDVVGPLQFTFAHEFGHWCYDVENPDQLTLVESMQERVLCRGLRQIKLDDSTRIREVNANRFAACLLLPRELLEAELTAPFDSPAAFRAAARAWGVSRRTLEIRVRELGRADLLPMLG